MNIKMNYLHRKLIIVSLLINSIDSLSVGEKAKKKPKVVKSKTLQVVGKNKGILKSSSGGCSSSVIKKHVRFNKKLKITIMRQYDREEKNPQKWQTDKEKERACKEVAKSVNAIESTKRWQAIKDRNVLTLKATRPDDLFQENKILKYCLFASAGIITTGAIYYFSTMRSSNEEL